MVKVKICGITSFNDAAVAIKAGCDALGFIFYKKSPRYIRPQKARTIISRLPKGTVTVGVFVNAREKTIKRIFRKCALKMLQFHGRESPEFCARFTGYKVIKAFRVKKTLDQKLVSRYPVFAYLFDTYSLSLAGGTGRIFDWKLLRHFDTITKPVFLSGGLSAKNVRAAIRAVRPSWVDASTALESEPGKKDSMLVQGFIDAAKAL